MLNNFSISSFSISLILLSPFISQSPSSKNVLTNSYFNLNCMKSIYPFLYSTSNANTNFKSSSFTNFQGNCPIYLSSAANVVNRLKIRTVEEIKNGTDLFSKQEISNSLLLKDYGLVSVTFQECKFINCYNEYGPGGAISFRKETASLYINSCQFIGCKAQYNAGALFFQVHTGAWVDGECIIRHSIFDECYDCKPDANYVAGVFEVFLMKGSNNKNSFSLFESLLKNCQYEKKNKINQGQLRLSANIFHVKYDNFTNDDRKIDCTAVLFTKYVQIWSVICYLNLMNQRGFTLFEIYDIQQQGVVNANNVNIVNTTFTNFVYGDILQKIGFFNTYLTEKDRLIFDNIFIFDFTTISTSDDQSESPPVEPFLFKYNGNSFQPTSSNVYSNKALTKDTTGVKYTVLPDMKYDPNSQFVPPKRVETPTATPKPTETPCQTEEPLLTADLSETIESESSSQFESESEIEFESKFESEIESESEFESDANKPSQSSTVIPVTSPNRSPTRSFSPSQSPSKSPTVVTVVTPIRVDDPNGLNSNEYNNKKKDTKKVGVIVGAVAAVVAVCTVVVVVLVLVLQKRRNRAEKRPSRETGPSDEDDDDEAEANVSIENGRLRKGSDPFNLRSLISSINKMDSSELMDVEMTSSGAE